MIVCIAEKPSVARDIADILGARERKEGYIEGNGYQVTWTFGHLCTLKEPHEYTPGWKSWSLGSLPMIPPRFGIKLIENPTYEKQFHIIEGLMQKADEIINCGDAGQEGELIQRWVMQKAGARCPVKRLWISSLTEEAIKEGFAKLKDQKDFQPLYEAGMSRAIGDWLLGMNATRLYTVKYGQNRQVLSIGRVQTPTLALIVNRQLDIENFQPKQYWELKTMYRDTTFSALIRKSDEELAAEEEKSGGKAKKTENRGIDPIANREEGMALVERIKDLPFVVTSVAKKDGKEYAPRLFDLTSLQVECNKKFAYSADETLKLIQSLYEKKVTTYPRVDTTFLSDDIYPKCPNILKGLKDYEVLTTPLAGASLPKSKKVFDSSKVTDHHAIIPTGVHPQNLTDMEATLLRAMETAGKLVDNDELRDALKENGIGRPSTRAAIIETLFKRNYIRKEKKNLIATPTGVELIQLIHEELLKSAELTGIWEKKLREIEKKTYDARQFLEELKQMVSEIVNSVLSDNTNRRITIQEATAVEEEKKKKEPKKRERKSATPKEKKGKSEPATVDVSSTGQSVRADALKETDSLVGKLCPVCGKGVIIKGKTAYGCSEWKNGCTYRKAFE